MPADKTMADKLALVLSIGSAKTKLLNPCHIFAPPGCGALPPLDVMRTSVTLLNCAGKMTVVAYPPDCGIVNGCVAPDTTPLT